MSRMQVIAVLLSASVGLAAGCKKSAPPAPSNSYTQDAVAAGGTLNSDGSVTNANGTITEPNGTVVQGNGSSAPAAQPNSASTPQQVPSNGGAAPANPPTPSPAPAPPQRTAPRGTSVTIRTNGEISSKADADGSPFSGVLERPVESHGVVVFERGTPVSGVVVASKNKGEFKGAGELAIVVTEIGHVRVHTSEYVLTNKGRGKRTGAFIGGGGGLGALIGGLAGGGKGALIGGLAGAGAGTAASTSGSKDVVIRPESVITFRLTESVSH
jgi:hypothetical protein